MEHAFQNVDLFNIEMLMDNANAIKDMLKILMDNVDQLTAQKVLIGIKLNMTVSLNVEHLKFSSMDTVSAKLAIKKIMLMESVFPIVMEIKWELKDFVNVLQDIHLFLVVFVFWIVLQVAQMWMECVYAKRIVEEEPHIAHMVNNLILFYVNVDANHLKSGYLDNALKINSVASINIGVDHSALASMDISELMEPVYMYLQLHHAHQIQYQMVSTVNVFQDFIQLHLELVENAHLIKFGLVKNALKTSVIQDMFLTQ